MPQGNLVEVLGREGRKGSPGELMVESSPSRQRRPPCKTNKEMSDEAADAAALTYLFTAREKWYSPFSYSHHPLVLQLHCYVSWALPCQRCSSILLILKYSTTKYLATTPSSQGRNGG